MSPLRMTKSNKTNIDLMIIGTDKSGTTALFKHIAQSPEVTSHSQREMFYFLSEDEYKRGWEYAVNKYYTKITTKIVLAKNVMQITSAKAMSRLKQQCPNVKCIIMIREPAARAYSAYNYALLRGVEDATTFEEALLKEKKRSQQNPEHWISTLYIKNSTYGPNLINAFNIYGRENVLVFYHEEYIRDPRKHLAKVEAFIGIKLFNWDKLELGKHNNAAIAKHPWLSRFTYKFLKSKNILKLVFRRAIPHKMATKLRHAILNYNRIEAKYPKLEEEVAAEIRDTLASDKKLITRLIGHCPW